MKTTHAIALIMVGFTSFQLRSANPEKDGVFRTLKDFEKNQLTDSIAPVDRQHYLKDNWLDRVVIKNGNTKHTYDEGEIYACRLNGKEYRYFDPGKSFAPKGYFEIVDTNGLIIYSQTTPDEKGGEKVSYYYSTGYNTPIKTLTRANLKLELKNKEYVMALFSIKDISKHQKNCFTVNCLYQQFKNLPADI